MKTINFPYINGTTIPIADAAVHVNTGWTHPRNDVRFNEPFVYELGVIEFFYSQIKDGDVILDVGAHSGLFSMLAKYNKTTTWHLFEPDPFNISNLKDNITVNKIENATLHEEALSDYVGECILNICTNHRGLNTIGKNPVRLSTTDGKYDHIPPEINLEKNLVETLLVKVNTIDNLFLDTEVDLIKIDTEGSEYDIIKGGIETIKKYKPKILLEYNAGNMGQCGHTPEKLNSLIEQIGYVPFWSDNGENLFIQFNHNA